MRSFARRVCVRVCEREPMANGSIESKTKSSPRASVGLRSANDMQRA